MKPGDKIVYYLTGRKAFGGIVTIEISLLRKPRADLGER